MRVLFGHPTGNPNSFHAALSHWKNDILYKFYLGWFPSTFDLNCIHVLSKFIPNLARLTRRHFSDLKEAPIYDSRASEILRLIKRVIISPDRAAYDGNDWLMVAMSKAVPHSAVDMIHSYEDCSLKQFQVAKKYNKVCLYDMPIGYYPWWENKKKSLYQKYNDFLPGKTKQSDTYVRPQQKIDEMKLADFVVAPSSFAVSTILDYADKKVSMIPYGVDLAFTEPIIANKKSQTFRLLFAGTCCVRKGTPLLLKAWEKCNWTAHEAELVMVGSWQLSTSVKVSLPRGVRYLGPVSKEQLSELYNNSHWFILPSNFEGFGLVLLEALSHGLPIIASNSTAAPDFPESPAVRIFESDNLDELIELLRFAKNIANGEYESEAKRISRSFSWTKYRDCLNLHIKNIGA